MARRAMWCLFVGSVLVLRLVLVRVRLLASVSVSVRTCVSVVSYASCHGCDYRYTGGEVHDSIVSLRVHFVPIADRRNILGISERVNVDF